MIKRRERTEKSKYKHESTGDYCTCAAYVAEIMCQRKAQHENTGSLAFKFWSEKPWDWTFKKQLLMAQKIVKKYSEAALVRAINSRGITKIFSLKHKKILPAVARCQKEIDERAKQVQVIEVKENPTTRVGSFAKKGGKRSKLNKLRNIENGKKESDEGN